MDTGRPDLNSLIKVASIPQDEPTFLLRAQDLCAADAVRAWCAFAAIAGAPPAVLEAAMVQADHMAAWPVKKLPGDDHLQDHERKQLEYQHGRRGWDEGTGAPWRLAQLRGHMPEHPATLLRQLAVEQQAAADLYVKKAAEHFRDAVKPEEDRSGRTAAFYDARRRAADEAANRAAYFLAIATALVAAAEALEPLPAAERVG